MQQIMYDPGWSLPTLTNNQAAPQPFTTAAMDVEGIAINFLRLLGRDSETKSVTLTQAFSLTTDSGSTLLHLSASLGFSKLLLDLVWRKLDLDRQDKNGNTPLHFSALYGQYACAQILVENGADTKIANFRGLTPRKVALDFQHTVIVDLLDEDLPDFTTPATLARSAPHLSLKEGPASPAPIFSARISGRVPYQSVNMSTKERGPRAEPGAHLYILPEYIFYKEASRRTSQSYLSEARTPCVRLHLGSNKGVVSTPGNEQNGGNDAVWLRRAKPRCRTSKPREPSPWWTDPAVVITGRSQSDSDPSVHPAFVPHCHPRSYPNPRNVTFRPCTHISLSATCTPRGLARPYETTGGSRIASRSRGAHTSKLKERPDPTNSMTLSVDDSIVSILDACHQTVETLPLAVSVRYCPVPVSILSFGLHICRRQWRIRLMALVVYWKRTGAQQCD